MNLNEPLTRLIKFSIIRRQSDHNCHMWLMLPNLFLVVTCGHMLQLTHHGWSQL